MDLLFIVPNALGGLYLAFLMAGLAKRRRPAGAPEVDNYLVVVVTVGDGRVLPALRETVSQLERLGLRYVVVSSRPLPMRNVLVVPPEEDGSKYRAVRWFVKNFARDGVWYVFLDDDSYPLDRQFLRDIAYYGARGYVAGNGVLVPRPGRSRLAYALDWVRTFHDLTTYRFSLEVLRRPFLGMHGELLIVRGDVLREVWPAMGDTVTEDFRFAMELLRRGYKTFQTTTKVSVKSPNSLRDFLRQRARWANSLWEAAYYKNFYMIGFAAFSASLWAASPLWVLYGPNLILVITALYIGVYTYGSIKARRFLVDVLFASLLELIGMAAGAVKKPSRFYVIDKT
ncbi:MAG: glycosyltransferase family 2 protein [Pyrobaculum sp.]